MLKKESGEHAKDARPSTKEKHEKGQARQKQDRGGENGDDRRAGPVSDPQATEDHGANCREVSHAQPRI
jgi:Cu/Zn superoxide dismutase